MMALISRVILVVVKNLGNHLSSKFVSAASSIRKLKGNSL
jgi:Flp pilus assembly pilin Flp